MKWFRQKLRERRIFFLTVLAVNLFYMVGGRDFVYAHQVHEQKEKRLRKISELLGVPVEKLRPDHETLFDSVKKLITGDVDPFKEAGLKRLQATMQKQEELLAANPYLPQIEEVKRAHAIYRVEGVLQDLKQLTQPENGLPEASQRALLGNLHRALQGDLTLAIPEGLPAKAQTKLAELQAKLDSLFESIRPITASAGGVEAQGETVATLAREIDSLKLIQNTETMGASREPRFVDRPLPLRRVEKKARIEEVTSASIASSAKTTPAVSKSSTTPKVPTKAAIAPEIVELAASLGNSPARIFRHVHDQIDFDPKWGAVKGPLGTLWEASGTPWDQAWLLHDLLVAAGVDARFEWGEVEISTELLTTVTGLEDPFRAGDLLTTAGVPVVLLVQGSQVIAARMPHVWIKAFVDYVPNRGVTPGPGDTWIRMDPSLKLYQHEEGVAVHQQTPFALQDYLLSATPQSPRRFYEDVLTTYNQDNMLWLDLGQIARMRRIVEERFPFLPGTLRGKIVSVDGESSEAPESLQQHVTLQVKTAAGATLVSWSSPMPELYNRRVEIAYAGATSEDQATIDAHGGIFETPPFLVELKPQVRLDGVTAADGAAIGSAEDTEVWVTMTPVNGAPDVLVHDTLAGEHHVLTYDLGRLPRQVVDRSRETLNAALAAGDDFLAETETLYLLGAQYMHDLGRDLDDLSSWTWQRLVKLGTEGLISQSGRVTTSIDGSPIGFARAEKNVDIASMPLGIFPATPDDGAFTRNAFELFGAQSSFLEGEVFDEVLQEEGIAAVSALTRSQREGQSLTRVDATNLDATLSAADLGADVESEVRRAVEQGKIGWLAEERISVNRWTGTGYVLEDPVTGAAAYLISGSLAGGSGTGEGPTLLDILGSEEWLDNSPYGPILRQLLAVLGLGGGPDDGPETQQSDPVNLSTGNYWLTAHDLTLQARGIPIAWNRVYNSRSEHNGPLGFGWTFSYGESLDEQVDGSVLYRESDGTEHFFTINPDATYQRPPGKHLELSKEIDGFRLRNKYGVVNAFALDGRLLSIADPHGNAVTLGYDPGGQLTSVSDAAGRAVLTVTSVGGLITEVADLDGRTVRYTYTGDDLTAVTDSLGETWTYAYDAEHNLIRRSNPLGNADLYAYDFLDRCYQHTDPLGNAERFFYTRIGQRAVHVDQRGFASFHEFDDRGRAVTRVGPLGNIARSTWDEDNNRTAIVHPLGGTTTRTFDERGNLLTETDADSNTTTRTYDPVFNKILTETDATGHTVTHTYDSNGEILSQTRTVGGETLVETFTYDAFGQVTEYRDPDDNPMTFMWNDTKGALASRTDALGQTTEITTDDLGRVVAITDPEDNVTALSWDDGDRPATMTDPHSHTVSFTYDAAGRQAAVTDGRGTVTTVYDAAGRVVEIVDFLGNTLRREHDAAGNVVARIDARGGRTSMTYDPLNRLVAVVDALGNVWTQSYLHDLGGPCAGCTPGPALGRSGAAEIIDPLGNRTEKHYDILGRLTQSIDPLGNESSFTYDPLGRLTATTDALGRETRFEYDEEGRLVAVEEAHGGRTEHTYDGNGNLINVRDAAGQDWPRAYDTLDRLTSASDPLGNTKAWTYDALGNVATLRNARGQLITFDYDVERRTAVHLPDGTSETFGYDVFGRLISIVNPEVSRSFTYDALGRLSAEVDNTLGETVQHEYDATGNRTALIGPLGRVEYDYNALNQLVEQRDPAAGTYRYAYDALHRRTELVYPNGMRSSRSYDPAGRVLGLITRNPLQQVIDGYSYTYDAVGNRASASSLRDGLTHSYIYDEVNRLTNWVQGPERFESYAYDLVGNRLSLTDELGETAYAYDAADRLSSEVRTLTAGGGSTLAYAWDADGNLTQRTEAAAVTTYQFDALDRLVGVAGPAGTSTYGYDPMGIRVRETDGGITRRLLHAREDVVGVFDGAGDLATYFSQGPGIDEPLAQWTAGEVQYLHRDALGSVTAYSSGSGQLSGTARYAAFGGVESATGTAGRYGYTSREADPTGLMYYRARYYEPQMGRFLSRDPFAGLLTVPASLHDYQYVFNNPIIGTDPTGETPLATAIEMFRRFFFMTIGGFKIAPHANSQAAFVVGIAIGLAFCGFLTQTAGEALFHAVLWAGIGLMLIGIAFITLIAILSGRVTVSPHAAFRLVVAGLFFVGWGLGCLYVSIFREAPLL